MCELTDRELRRQDMIVFGYGFGALLGTAERAGYARADAEHDLVARTTCSARPAENGAGFLALTLGDP